MIKEHRNPKNIKDIILHDVFLNSNINQNSAIEVEIHN